MTTPLARLARWRVPPGIGLVALAFGIAHAAAPAVPKAPPLPPDHALKMARGRELFQQKVRAILTDNCVKCHGGGKTRGGLDLTSREALLKGGDNGAVVVPYRAKE